MVALYTLAFHIHFTLRCDDGLDIVGFGKCAHIHIIVHHKKLAFQIGSAETVVFDLLDACGIHAVTENGAHHQTDTAFALAALADQHEHLLTLGGGYQTVAEIFLQGGNVLRYEQIGQKMQPSFRLRCVWVICHFQAVVAVGLILGKCAVQEIRAVCHMNTVCFHGQRRRVCHEFQTGKQIRYRLGNAICQTASHFVQYHLADLALILNDAVHRKQATTDTFHGMKP